MSDLYNTTQDADRYRALLAEIKSRFDARTAEHAATFTDLDRAYALGMMVELNSLLHWIDEDLRWEYGVLVGGSVHKQLNRKAAESQIQSWCAWATPKDLVRRPRDNPKAVWQSVGEEQCPKNHN